MDVLISSINICGVKVSCVNLNLACELISQWVKTKQKKYVCVAPASTIVDCQHDEAYRQVVNAAGMVTPDGMPVVWVAKFKKVQKIDRTYGPDLMMALAKFGMPHQLKHYFYGATDQVCQQLIKNLKTRVGPLRVVGYYSPMKLQLHEFEKPEVIQQINRLKPDVLWIGLGSPKQDFWMKNHQALLDVPVMIGVGAAFDFLSGAKKQAPYWMQRSGLEWIFRLCCEPKRLWRRYLIGNVQFILYVIRDLLQKRCKM